MPESSFMAHARKLWINDPWTCSICKANYPYYPENPKSQPTGWEVVSEKILCKTCLFHYWEIDHGLWDKYSTVDRIWCYDPFEVPVEEPKTKEYWYYWVWTLAPNHNIDEVRSNIERFINCDLKIYYCDISFEHGDKNGREHYNMRIKAHKAIKGQRIRRYEKAGKINRQTIRKRTQENWDNVGNYCSKENEIEVLIDTS